MSHDDVLYKSTFYFLYLLKDGPCYSRFSVSLSVRPSVSPALCGVGGF